MALVETAAVPRRPAIREEQLLAGARTSKRVGVDLPGMVELESEEVLERGDEAPEFEPSRGCSIKWKAGNEPDYWK